MEPARSSYVRNHLDTLEPPVLVTIDHDNDRFRVQLLELLDEAVPGDICDSDEASGGLPEQLQGEFLVALELGVEDSRP